MKVKAPRDNDDILILPCFLRPNLHEGGGVSQNLFRKKDWFQEHCGGFPRIDPERKYICFGV